MSKLAILFRNVASNNFQTLQQFNKQRVGTGAWCVNCKNAYEPYVKLVYFTPNEMRIDAFKERNLCFKQIKSVVNIFFLF